MKVIVRKRTEIGGIKSDYIEEKGQIGGVRGLAAVKQLLVQRGQLVLHHVPYVERAQLRVHSAKEE